MLNIKMQSQNNRLKPKITVIGVGGAGGNAVNNMIFSNLEGCEFLVCNTDAQALEGNAAGHKIQLGVNVTRGLGAGANPEIGRAAAEESLDDIAGYLDGANMVFVTAGMGGGTGTGAAAVIAEMARSAGILTIGVVTKPFHFEGTHRMKLAEAGIEELQKYVDTLIVIPNQNLFRIANEKTTFADAFRMADEVLQSGVRGVTDLMVMPGLINLDFADVRAVMAEMGKAMMGTGEGTGEKRALEAAEAAISNPLLDDISMKGARGVLINVIGGGDLTLFEVDEAVNRVREEVDPDANIIFGSTLDQNLDGSMRVSIVATGIDINAARMAPRPVNLAGQAPTTISRPTATINTPQPRPAVTAAATQTGSGGYSGYQRSGEKVDALTTGRGIPGSIIPTAGQTAVQQPQASAQQRTPVTAGGGADTAVAEQPMQTGQATTTTYAASATATARKPEEAQTWQRPAQTQSYQRPVPSMATPRGERVGDTFIPPRPVDPAIPAAPSAGDLFSGMEEQPLTAPVKPAAAPVEKKKAPSLFERFTMQRKDDKPAVSADTGLSAHDGDKEEEEELDIPAFLRRQAN